MAISFRPPASSGRRLPVSRTSGTCAPSTSASSQVVREVIAATGALAGKTRRAMDSTILEDALATQDTVIQLIAATRRVRREVPGAAEVVAAPGTAHDHDDPGKPAIAWNDLDARARLVDALVTDAHWLLAHLPEHDLGPRGAPAPPDELSYLATDDVERAPSVKPESTVHPST